jgi:hypothetical protein
VTAQAALPRSARIVPTAPLFGVDLARPDRLPHAAWTAPAPAATADAPASEPDAATRVAGWRPLADYAPPPLLDPARPEAAAAAARIAKDATRTLARLQRAAAGDGDPDRGFQRKTLYATTTARFLVPANLPPLLAAGPFQPGAAFRAILRFSNAGSTVAADRDPDQRAVGVRIIDDAGRVQDLTFTSGAAGNHARDARQFVSSMAAVADGLEGGRVARLRALAGLLRREGLGETLRLARARREAVDKGVSLAALAYYSRSPFEMGARMVHLALLPVGDPPKALVFDARGARDGLGRDLTLRRAAAEIRFRVAAAEAPPLADLSRPPAGPWLTVAEIRLPRQASGEAEMLAVAAAAHASLAIHPFNRWDETALRPRGELNEILRGPVYRASAATSGRRDDPPATPLLGA